MVLYDSPGLAPLRPLGYLFVRTKRYQKAAGGVPPVPPASPSGRYSIWGFICAPTNRVWFYPSAYPSSATAQRLPTGSNGGEAAGGVRCKFTAQRLGAIPRCRLYPFKRPAGVQWPTATSNPKPPVAAHGRSSSSTSLLDQNPVGNSCSRGTAALHLRSVSEDPP